MRPTVGLLPLLGHQPCRQLRLEPARSKGRLGAQRQRQHASQRRGAGRGGGFLSRSTLYLRSRNLPHPLPPPALGQIGGKLPESLGEASGSLAEASGSLAEDLRTSKASGERTGRAGDGEGRGARGTSMSVVVGVIFQGLSRRQSVGNPLGAKCFNSVITLQ